MIDFKKYEYLYFLGIGGMGMSALARYFASQGYLVSGYDRIASHITDQLISESIDVNFEDSINAIPDRVKANNTSALIIYTPAISTDNQQLMFFKDHRFSLYKRAEVLGEVTKNHYTVAVAGTHGKTSTSWMLSHLLKQAGTNAFTILGGVSVNYNTNFLSGLDINSATFVVEADEYDRSFLKLLPDVEIITSIEPDHLDIYGSFKQLQSSFIQFTMNLKSGGYIFYNEHCEISQLSVSNVNLSYGFSENADIRAERIRIEDNKYVFNITSDHFRMNNVILSVAGKHNVMNALPVIAYCKMVEKMNDDDIKTSLFNYLGVKRRMECVLRLPGKIVIDDYAHHPTEINATLSTLREMFPGEKITCIFQPHLYTRTRDFAGDFGKALSNSDRLAILDIYPARELPLPGINSELILKYASVKDKTHLHNHELIPYVLNDQNGILVFMGAGDIDQFVEPVKNKILTK